MTTQGDTLSEEPILRLRITHVTSTMAGPLPTLLSHYTPSHLATAVPPGVTPYRLPVLRIFGTTQHLQKICANIHLVYPYFFVPFPMDSSAPDPLRPERVVRICQRFAVSLNHAICLAMRQNPTDGKYGGGTDPKHLHVVSVVLCKGTPFYGYHIGYSYFLKVSLVNPARLYVALEQLRKPVVLGREWQPFEAHVNHVLQFMCDYDLYGCGWLDLAGGTFREPLPGDPYGSPPSTKRTIFNTLTVPPGMIYESGYSPPKDTYTPLEIDILPHQILNRRRLVLRRLHQDFVELLHKPLDPLEKLVPAMKELWEDERRRRAIKNLSLSEGAMLPSGGMDGRNMAELGYKIPGQVKADNRGGDWKRSDEMWDMLQERMEEERRKSGPLSFERFSTEAAAGKNGEKRRYDKWIMTTFEAVSAHWPRQPKTRSTQRSKRSANASSAHQASSPAHLASSPPLPFKSSPTSPPSATRVGSPPDGVKVEDDLNAHVPVYPAIQHGIAEDSDSDEEENPFDALNMTQRMPDDVIEVNPSYIQRNMPLAQDEEEEDDPDPDRIRQLHEQDAQKHAEESARVRATQVHRLDEDQRSEYDDEEIDELFRQTINGGLSTPKKSQRGGSVTPTSGGSSGSTLAFRRARRDQRLREQAGLGDLSIIMDRSSISLSPSKPLSDNLSTPTKTHMQPPSEKVTPNSMLRNMFARNRPSYSPQASPSKPPTYPGNGTPKTVVLTPSKRSAQGWQSPSPEPELEDQPEGSPTPTKTPMKHTFQEVKQELKEIEASDEKQMNIQAGQIVKSSKSSGDSNSNGHRSEAANINGGAKREMSPTLKNDEQSNPFLTLSGSKGSTGEAGDGSTPRAKKRVRMASPEARDKPHSQLVSTQTLLPTPPHLALSQMSIPSNPTDDSTSTVPSHLSSTAWTYRSIPPSRAQIATSMEEFGVDSAIYTDPHYSNRADIPPRAKMFAGRMFTLRGNGLKEMDEFESSLPIKRDKGKNTRHRQTPKHSGWEYAPLPPRSQAVISWCAEQDALDAEKAREHAKVTSQLSRPTQKNKYGFKFSQKKKSEETEREHQNMSVLALEIFSKSRHQLLPDPEKDELTAVFYCYQNEDVTLPDTTTFTGYYAGYIVVGSSAIRNGQLKLDGVPCQIVESELDLINTVIDMVKHWDPDVLAGWELHNSSWGWVSSRAEQAFGIDFTEQLSRVVGGHTGPKKDFYSATHASTFKVSGRHILNIWRICRSEINLTQYTFENVVFHLLHQRIPHFSPASLTSLWKSKTPEHTHRVLKYYFQRVVMYVEIIDRAEIITKNAEFARVFGVDFASVMFRGSQFKVESFIFRLAKPESFVLVSPSKQQVGLQNAPFAVPLIAEPESKYYNHPIIVLDFQSLYPSIMIAYNLCYSTCLGRVEKFKGTDKFGFTELKVADGLLELLKDYLTVTPNGMVFVKPAVRKSLLAKMLAEILDTRVMIKHAMKGCRNDKGLTSLLNARQLGLKLMANVTYGYTSATYSGRMPCIEIADSIVQTGRETLEKAQELIHSRSDWNAQVVYGDTDSLFVALPGRSKEQAFVIGNDIADSVTALNPKPVRLKFEKVYMGSVLMAKKRYVGFKYEHPDDKEPVFDAKGIETIRRDGFPAQGRMEEVCLKMLFRHQDLSLIKEFCRQEWTKILQGRVSIQDFIVAKEVRLGSYSEKGVPPPGAAVAYRRILKDPRDEPQYAERVPYIVSNADGRRLIDRARMPEEMLANRSLNIDAEYYIRNLLIPPLSRIFNLVGADVENWYDSMPRTKRAGKYDFRPGGDQAMGSKTGKMRIDSHFKSSHCVVCGLESASEICSDCTADPSRTSHTLLSRDHLAQSRLTALHRICGSCSSTPVGEPIMCDSVDCPITYARVQATRDVDDLKGVQGVLKEVVAEEGVEVGKKAFWEAMEW